MPCARVSGRSSVQVGCRFALLFFFGRHCSPPRFPFRSNSHTFSILISFSSSFSFSFSLSFAHAHIRSRTLTLASARCDELLGAWPGTYLRCLEVRCSISSASLSSAGAGGRAGGAVRRLKSVQGAGVQNRRVNHDSGNLQSLCTVCCQSASIIAAYSIQYLCMQAPPPSR